MPLWVTLSLRRFSSCRRNKKQQQSMNGTPSAIPAKRAAVVDMQQKRLDKTFREDKARILESLATSSGCDNSPKGFVDAACLPLMQLLNRHPDYVTTSSCSGRIALFHTTQEEGLGGVGSGVKRGGPLSHGWVYVTHNLVTPDDASAIVDSMCSEPLSMEASSALLAAACSNDATHQAPVGESVSFRPPSHGTLSLKCEPFVMHVQCRTMDSAKLLLSAAVSDAGFRNSGVVPPGARIMVAIRHAGLSLDVPLVLGGVQVVTDTPSGRTYLAALLRSCNAKLAENFQRIIKLERAVAQRLQLQMPEVPSALAEEVPSTAVNS